MTAFLFFLFGASFVQLVLTARPCDNSTTEFLDADSARCYTILPSARFKIGSAFQSACDEYWNATNYPYWNNTAYPLTFETQEQANWFAAGPWATLGKPSLWVGYSKGIEPQLIRTTPNDGRPWSYFYFDNFQYTDHASYSGGGLSWMSEQGIGVAISAGLKMRFEDYDSLGAITHPFACFYHIPSCFGIPGYFPSVCSGHGNCYGTDQCVCDSDIWFLPECGPTCGNIAYNAIGVCNDHGVCRGLNDCECDRHTHGLTCEIDYVCYGKTWRDSDVCSGRGDCRDHDYYCACDLGAENETIYYGDQCEHHFCDLIPSTHPEVCNGHGVCSNTDVCQCSTWYEGTWCQVYFGLTTGATVGIALGGTMGPVVICLVITVLIIVCVLVRLKKRNLEIERSTMMAELTEDESREFARLEINKSLFEIQYEDLQVKRKIGSGGSNAEVFVAMWAGRTVAFKCFRLQDFLGAAARFEEFEREVTLLASLSHPNILRFYGACISPPRVGILMEYCSNGDLSDYVLSTNCPIIVRLRLLLETAMGMLVLHQKRVVHRDLKPENVLISEQIDGKICDFGLSRIIEDAAQEKTRAVGTSVYMAPQVFSGEYGFACDVFSFGVMCHTVLMGNFRPYGDAVHPEVKVAADRDFRPVVDDKWPEEARWVVPLMKRCWEDEESARPDFQVICDEFSAKWNQHA